MAINSRSGAASIAAIIAAIDGATDEQHAALRAALKSRGQLAEPLSAKRAAGTFTCGTAGHGKDKDGHFATQGGFDFHMENTKHA